MVGRSPGIGYPGGWLSSDGLNNYAYLSGKHCGGRSSHDERKDFPGQKNVFRQMHVLEQARGLPSMVGPELTLDKEIPCQ
jgi:hypothetical protein